MKNAHFPTHRQAFSLVELMVILAVIAGLAGLILPALASAQNRTRSIECISNLHQWGIGFRIYADDNNDFLPRRGQGVQTLSLITRQDDWFNALPCAIHQPSYLSLLNQGRPPAPGVHSWFVCPSATPRVASGKATLFLAYGMNMNLSTWNLPLPAKFSEIVRPESVVALADAPGSYASTFPSIQPYGPLARHAGRVNLLLLAGAATSFAGDYAGCGVGDCEHDDLHWLTGTASDTQARNY